MGRWHRRVGRCVCVLAVLAAPPAWAGVLSVGAGQTYSTLAAAVAAAAAGDTIDIYGGTYTNQTADITKPLTLVGVDGTPVFTATGQLSNDKGFLVIDASTTVENITFENALADPASNNGAGIRYQSGNLTVLDSSFISNQDGILATPTVGGTGAVVVRNSLFKDNGVASGPGAGFAHALYATDLASLTVTGSTFQGTQTGHDIKSRAVDTVIIGNYLDDGVTGTTSYAIDLPNGGNATIIGNTIDQGPNTQNPIMVAYGEEGLTHTGNTALIDGNSFINSLTTAVAVGVNNAIANPAATAVTVACNAFDGVPVPTAGPVTLVGNVTNAALPACAAGVAEPPGLTLLLAPLLAVLALRRRIDAAAAAA